MKRGNPMTICQTDLQDRARIRPPAFHAYDIVRSLLGLLLLAAAALKGYELATTPLLGRSFLDSRWVVLAAVPFEFALGCFLLTGQSRRLVWAVASFSFALFSAVTAYKAWSGQASCGCFGRVQVDPRYTLALDLAALLSLLIFRPGLHRPTPIRIHRLLTPAIVATSLLIAAGLCLAMLKHTPVTGAADFIGNDKLVLLQPEEWVGRQFPLLPFTSLGDRLATGSWIVVFYHYDCPQCREELPHFERLARQAADQPDQPRILLLEVPPYAPPGKDPVPQNTLCTRGRLDESREWFVQTPAEVRLTDGIVTRAKEGAALR